MAAPHVAAMAALPLARFPGWSTEFITTTLLNSVEVYSDLAGMNAVSGMINLEFAIEVDDSDLALFTEYIAPSFGTVAGCSPGACEGDWDGDPDIDGLDPMRLLDF